MKNKYMFEKRSTMKDYNVYVRGENVGIVYCERGDDWYAIPLGTNDVIGPYNKWAASDYLYNKA